MENKLIEYTIDNGILFSKFQKNLRVSPELAKQIVEERLTFQNGINYPIIISLNGMKPNSKETRIYLATEGIKGLTMGAFIVKNTIDEFVLKLFLIINKPLIPTKIFSCREDAIQWVNEMRNKNRSKK